MGNWGLEQGERRTVIHGEAHGFVPAVPPLQTAVAVVVAVLAVHKGTGDGARAGVHVLVGAPAREVNVPVVQLELHVAGGVGEVPADGDAAGVSVGGDGGDVQELAAVVLDTGQEDQGELVGVLVDD